MNSKGKNTLARLLFTLANVHYREGELKESKEGYLKARALIIDVVENIEFIKEMDRNIKDCCDKLKETYEEPQEEVYKIAESQSQMNNPYGSLGQPQGFGGPQMPMMPMDNPFDKPDQTRKEVENDATLVEILAGTTLVVGIVGVVAYGVVKYLQHSS